MKRLNIACGSNIFPGWINIDRTDLEHDYLRHLRGLDISQMNGWPEEQVEHSRAITEGRLIFVQRDLRKGFPDYEDGSIDAVYLGQCVEHLNLSVELPALLKECCRLLRPGGRVRITTPDLIKLLRAYNDGTLADFASEQPGFYRSATPEMQLSLLMFGASGPTCTREDYEGHFMCLAPRDLCALLSAAGLEPDTEGPERSAMFADCVDKGLSHSMAIEASKP